MDVVVVIPVFNRATILRRVLDAVGAQTHLPRQVVIVDDGSTDGSGAIAQAWIDHVQDRISCRLRTVPNAGCGAARNRGLEVMDSADAVHFLDSDDVIPSDFYERALSALAVQPDAIAASADQIYVDGEGNRVRERSLAGIANDATKWLVVNDPGIFSATVLRAETVRRFGPLREGHSSGDDTWFLIPVSRDARWLHLAGAPVEYGVHGDNMTNSSPQTIARWAGLLDDVIPLSGLPWRLRSSVVSRKWRRAGSAYIRSGDAWDARACFVRALRHRPLYVKAWCGLIRSWVSRGRERTAGS